MLLLRAIYWQQLLNAGLRKCCQKGAARFALLQKANHKFGTSLRLVGGHDMTGILHQFEAGTGNAAGNCSAIFRRDKAVLIAVDN